MGDKIKELRKSAGWSQAELAYKINTARGAVTVLEKGNGNPLLITIMKFAEIFNVPISELTGEETSSLPNDELKIFFRKWGDIKNLNKISQQLLRSVIKLLKESAI